MATTHFTTPTLSNAAAAIGVRNRLQKDLDELQRAAAGAMTLEADNDGHLFDLGCHLHSALQSMENAIQAVERYRQADRAAKMVAKPFCFFCPDADHETTHCPKVEAEGERTAKLQIAADAAALLNECFA